MMVDCPGHGAVLAVGYTELSGGFSDDPCEWRVVRMADMRAQMVDDVMVQPAGEPTDERIFSRIIGGGSEDVVHAVVKLAAIDWKVGAVDGVGGLEHERDAQPNDQVHQKKRTRDQQRRFSKYQDWQDEHVGEVEGLAHKQDGDFTPRMPGAPQIFVGGKEKALEVPEEHVVKGKQRINEESVDMLKPVPWGPGFMGRKAEDAAS